MEENKVKTFSSKVQAGFPSPADDYLDGSLNLHELLVTNAPATFFVRVQGDSMIDVGIFNDDLLVVDKSLTPHSGSVIIASLNGEFTVKKLSIVGDQWILVPCNRSNPKYQNIVIEKDSDFAVWGVVTNSIHSHL